MHRIQEEVLINSFYTLNSIFYFFPISISINGTTAPTDGKYIAIIALFSLHLFSRVISVVFICLCFKVSNSLQIYEEQR